MLTHWLAPVHHVQWLCFHVHQVASQGGWCLGLTAGSVQVGMTPEQASLYKAAVQKVRDEVMAAVEAANAANSGGSAAGR
jgi:hypothetical protein